MKAGSGTNVTRVCRMTIEDLLNGAESLPPLAMDAAFRASGVRRPDEAGPLIWRPYSGSMCGEVTALSCIDKVNHIHR